VRNMATWGHLSVLVVLDEDLGFAQEEQAVQKHASDGDEAHDKRQAPGQIQLGLI
jgi:hypothetical protein